MHKRKFKNILIEPFKQIKIGLYLIALNLLFGISSGGTFYYFISDYYKVVANLVKLFKLPAAFANSLSVQAESTKFLALCLVAMFCLLFILITIVLTLKWTHRMYGPILSINNHLKQILEDGSFSPITLRKGDDFKVTANLINQVLARKKIQNG